jgi:transposase
VNVLTQQKRNTVETLLGKGVSQHEIHRKTGIDRKTIRKIARLIAELGSNSPMATGVGDGAAQIPPPRPPAPKEARSACEPHREWIEAQIRLGRNAMAIYQDLVDHHGFTSRYNSVKRFCRCLKKTEPAQFDRLEFLPGEEAQVDYGEGALTLSNGRYRRPRLFVMTLRYSRRSFRKVVWKSSSETWARLHEEAFRYFGGAVRYVVLDNLKEGVIKPDIFEPELNRVYAEMLRHYGVVADAARVRDPNRKGTVESAIQHTQATALKGRRFESIEAQNEFLAQWETNWAAKRIHGRAKRQVEDMFQEERPHLQPLPLEPFRYFTECQRTVQDDTTVQLDGAWYAARPAGIGTQVLVRGFLHDIEIRDIKTLALIRRHTRIAKGSVELPEDERVFNPSRQTRQPLASKGHRAAHGGGLPAPVRPPGARVASPPMGHRRFGQSLPGLDSGAGMCPGRQPGGAVLQGDPHPGRSVPGEDGRAPRSPSGRSGAGGSPDPATRPDPRCGRVCSSGRPATSRCSRQ